MTNAPEQSVCRTYCPSGSSMASSTAPVAATFPASSSKESPCRASVSSSSAVMSAERWRLITETLPHRASMSFWKTSSWSSSARCISAFGLLSSPKRNSPAHSAAVSSTTSAIM